MSTIITIPAYNEQETITKVINDIKEAMKGYQYKILVVDDGSTDKTAETAEKQGAIVRRNSRNLGLAETFKVELKECLKLGADIIVHTDADNQYQAKYIPVLIKKVKQGNDIVLGSRFGKGCYSGSFLKKLGNIAFARLFSGLLHTKITDTTTGFRAFTKEVAELPLINNFTYTQEQIIRAGKKHMKIGEVPIKTNKTRKSRLFKNSIDYAIKAWINIFRIYRDFEPLKFFGLIGTVMFSMGTLVALYFVYLHYWGSGITGHLGLLMLMLLLILTGIQIILFGFLADMNRR
jgi:glycosyltransferase involved in cell wall biosynthesis